MLVLSIIIGILANGAFAAHVSIEDMFDDPKPGVQGIKLFFFVTQIEGKLFYVLVRGKFFKDLRVTFEVYCVFFIEY